MIYVIDHEDSFTYNLVHLLESFSPTYVSNYYDINWQKLEKSKIIIFSPGPGNPYHYPETQKVYKKYKGNKKIIGICLGFQQILYAEKAKIVPQKKIYHGYQSKIKVLKESALFKPSKVFLVGRYHSLKLKEPFNSSSLKITMRCIESNVAMAIEDTINNVYGFQFHPDSFLTVDGKLLIQKIIQA